MKNQNRPARNALQRNAGGGFIKIAIILVVALVLLKYVYDIDVVGRVYDGWLWIWGRYGDSIMNVWEWLKDKVGL